MFMRAICIALLLAVVTSPAFSQKPQLSPARLEYAKHLYASLLKAVRYPQSARPGKLEGVVVVQFQVKSDGRISSRRILTSSGHAILDQAALQAVDRVNRLPPFSPALKKEATSLSFTLPLRFRVGLLGKIFGL